MELVDKKQGRYSLKQLLHKLKSLTVKQKMMAGFGFTLVVLLLTITLILLILFQVQQSAKAVVFEDQPALVKTLKVSGSVKVSLTHMGLYIATKDSFQRALSVSHLNHTIAEVSKLKAMEVIRRSSRLTKAVLEIEKNTQKIQKLHARVLYLTSTPTKNFPGVAYSTKHINEHNKKILSTLDKMLSSEYSEGGAIPRTKMLKLLKYAQLHWVHTMSSLRAYLGFRAPQSLVETRNHFAEFAKTIDVIEQKYAKSLFFEQQDVFPVLLSQRKTIWKHFSKVIKIHGGESWRMDAWLIRKKLTPLVETLDGNLIAVTNLLQELMNKTGQLLIEDTYITSFVSFFMLIMVMVTVVLLAWMLTKGIINPMSKAIDNGLDRFRDLIREISEKDSEIFDRQNISSDDTRNIGITFDLMGQAMESAIRRQMDNAAGLTKRVEEIMVELQKAAAGDLTVQIDVQMGSGQAIDKLAVCIENMLDNINSLVLQIDTASKELTSTSEVMVKNSKDHEATVTEQAASTNQVMATVASINKTSQSLVTTMSDVHVVAGRTADTATNSQSALSRMEETMEQMNQATDAISSKLAVLSDKAGNINTVVTTINKVADQTNLLSLNAAIEAEKAGEYGRGFAVVATEIRRLADQTAVATWDIEQMIKEMQSAVSAGVMGMDKFSEEVVRGVSEVREVGAELAEIIAQVQALTPKFDVVNTGMKSQSVAATQINDSMEQLNSTAHETARSLRDSNESIEGLTSAAQALSKSVSRFKVDK